MKTLAVIPARGGSKGIPKKNTALLMGKPLVAYMIEAAKNSQYINEIVVSTDDDEIANVARSYGAKVKIRPSAISGDGAKSEDALLDVLTEYDADLLVFLQCTAPFTTTEDIDETIRTLLDNKADTALAVTPFHYFLWTKDGEGINHQKSERLLRQQRTPQYLEAGSVYLMLVDGFKKYQHRFFGKTVLHVVPASHVLEIDEPFDLALAESILQQRKFYGG